MAASSSRDLKFSLVSDLSKFDLDGGARDLDDVGRAAADAARELATLDDGARELDRVGDAADTSARKLDDLDDSVRRNDLERLGTDARDTARKVDDAFDTIARASRRSAADLDGDTDRMGRSLDGVRDEANDTAREMAASFDGTGDSVLDAFQELGANAGVALGPLGIAAGAAAAAGVGLIRAEAEALKELAAEMVEEMVAAGGRLTEEAINAKIERMATEDPDALNREKRMVDDLGVSWRDYARAKAGDGEAAERVTQQLADANAKLTEQAEAAGSATGAMYTQQTAISELADNVATASSAYAIAKEATEAFSTATGSTAEQVATHAQTAGGAWDDLRNHLAPPIKPQVKVDAPSYAELRGIRAGIQAGIGTIVVPVKPGQSPYANTADNSRYRW